MDVKQRCVLTKTLLTLRRYLDVVSTFFKCRGRQIDVNVIVIVKKNKKTTSCFDVNVMLFERYGRQMELKQRCVLTKTLLTKVFGRRLDVFWTS